MIKALELENVRIFTAENAPESGWKFQLSPLTIFCGTNSSGKSTLLRSLLLLRQSQGIGESQEVAQGQLRFVGSQVDLGNYIAFVSNNDLSRDISIGVTIEDSMPGFTIDPLFVRGYEGSRQLLYTLDVVFRFGVKSGYTTEQNTGPVDALEMSGGYSVLRRASFYVSINEEKSLSWEVLPSSDTSASKHNELISFDIVVPKNQFSFWGRVVNESRFIKEDNQSIRLSTNLRGLLPDGIWDNLGWDPVRLPSSITKVLADLQKALRSLHYLGPLRLPVKRYHLSQMNISLDSDSTGEFLWHVLRDRAKYIAWNIYPGQSGEAKRENFATALNSWLAYLRTGCVYTEDVGHEITVSTTKEVLIECQIRSVSSPASHALTDSGFGYTQVLPVLVKGLLAEPGSTLIIEQPDLHLSPGLQIRLAEFLVAMVRAGKQVLIETHSEHIIDAVRVLVAEDETDELASLCRIFFVDVEAGRPVTHNLTIQSNGSISELPANFFGEIAALHARLLSAQQRHAKKQ